MGMAASQARFLGLTARKSNIEYEGQQINQERTTLSNQSANYYTSLLGMEVPTAPSVDDYTTTVYTFEDGSLSNTITALIANGDGYYTVSYLRSWDDDYSVVAASTSIVSRSKDADGNYSYSIGATTLRNMAFLYNGTYYSTLYTYETDEDGNYVTDDYGNLIIATDDDGNTIYSDVCSTDSYLSTLTDDQLAGLETEELAYIQLLNDKYGDDGDTWYVRYVQDTTTGEYVPYFYKVSDVEEASYSESTGASLSNIACYTVGTETKQEEIKAVEQCKVEKDSTGRYISICIPSEYDDEGNAIAWTTYSLTTTTTTDQDAYEDAMNQYEYEKYEYDQTITEINAKIEIVQAEDKELELRLKQLDTEQDAVQTEIDSVSKVIEKNVESSFKTFA